MSTLDNFVCLHCLTEPVNATENEEIDEPVFALSWSLVNAKSNQVINEITKTKAQITPTFRCGTKFQQFIEENLTSRGEKWSIVTDGQLTLRHFIHTQAIKNKIKLSEDFYNFYDLRKEFQREESTMTTISRNNDNIFKKILRRYDLKTITIATIRLRYHNKIHRDRHDTITIQSQRTIAIATTLLLHEGITTVPGVLTPSTPNPPPPRHERPYERTFLYRICTFAPKGVLHNIS
ncbi:predicted protein [Nematostella vectensis]|uniref:Uncharacterized protein n=1 Tax=Nematostella vectensis TaxID=45351 RepID=A7RMK6_NEMVE|nr:predicted protein [Nematostella vectensis]|eukprot:XP_001639348.1 predicted protein [Nematostella vectensis]